MSLKIKQIKADIHLAKHCMSPIVNLFNDEALYSQAAYHTEQATEKCLKVILSQYYNIKEYDKRYRTHDIVVLLAYIRECSVKQGKSIPIKIPTIIDTLSVDIKEWEANSRYNDNMVILKDSIIKVIKACEKMYYELKKKKFL